MRAFLCFSLAVALAGPVSAQCLIDELRPAGLPSDAGFGRSVARDGDTLFVGAPEDVTNGNPTGAVYWYRRVAPAAWTLEDRFPGELAGGHAVAIDGQWAAYSVGGGVRLLRRSGPGTWSAHDFIAGGAGVEFGNALDIQDGPTPRLVIGMPGAPVGQQAPQVWTFDGSSWVHEHTFVPSDGEFGQYGYDVAIDGVYVLVGAPDDGDGALGAGSVYTYFLLTLDMSTTTWVEVQELLPPWAGAQNFGETLDASDSGLIVGAPGSDPSRYSLWRRTGNSYSVDITPTGGTSSGHGVAIDGNRALARVSPTLIQVIERDPNAGTWSLVGSVSGPNGFGESVDIDNGRFVVGVLEDQGSVQLRTYPLDDCNGNGMDDICDIANGVDGDADNDGIPNRCDCEVFEYCKALPNSTGSSARLGSDGIPSVSDNAFKLVADNQPAGVPGLFFYGATEVQIPFGDGFRCVGGTVTRMQPPMAADADGVSIRTIDFTSAPTMFVPGDTRKFQLWFRDPMGPGGSGFNLTPGLSVSFCE